MTKTIKLTERVVGDLETTKESEIIRDSIVAGFGVRIRRSGRKTYMASFRLYQGQKISQKKVALGTHPTIKVEAARKLAQKILAEARLGEYTGVKEDVEVPDAVNEITIAELCAEWLEDDGKRSRMRGKRYGELRDPKNVALDRGRILRHIDPLIGKIRVIDLTPKHIRKMRDDIAAGKTAVKVKTKKHGLAIVKGGEGTAARTVRILSTILSYAIREEIIDKNPATMLAKTPVNYRERYLTKDELNRLHIALNEEETEYGHKHGITVIRLLLMTGCRKSEIEKLQWSEIDLERGFFYFRKSKTGAKVIPMAKPARDILREYPREPGSEYVFAANKDRLSTKGADRPYVGTPGIWLKIRKRAGITDVRLHDLRHTFASMAAAKGLSLPMIGALLGHSQPSTTARYAHLANQSLQDASELVSAALEEVTSSE